MTTAQSTYDYMVENMTLEVANQFQWGIYGLAEDGYIWKLGPNSLEYKPLGELDTDHLQNILITQNLNGRGLAHFRHAIELILKERQNDR